MSVELQEKVKSQESRMYLLEKKIQALTSELRDLRSKVSQLENEQRRGYPGYE